MIFKKLSNKLNSNKTSQKSAFSSEFYQTYFHDFSKASWTNRNYQKFSEEGYIKNVIAHRSIGMIAKSVAQVDWQIFDVTGSKRQEVKNHPLLKILKSPNPFLSGNLFLETIASHKIINGNCYIYKLKNSNGVLQELHILRPDRVSISTDKNGNINHYVYKTGAKETKIPVNKITGESDIIHLKNFHPLDDYYGLSSIDAAAYSIDQHNNAAKWNQSLLQNGAKPSGALIVKSSKDGGSDNLTDEQFDRIKSQISEQYGGYNNAGKPILLEGGLDWREMSLPQKIWTFWKAKTTPRAKSH